MLGPKLVSNPLELLRAGIVEGLHRTLLRGVRQIDRLEGLLLRVVELFNLINRHDTSGSGECGGKSRTLLTVFLLRLDRLLQSRNLPR